MSWASELGGDISSGWQDFTSSLAGKTKGFKATPYQIDPNAYKDPNGAALTNQWAQLQQQSQGQQAPTINGAPQGQFRQGQLSLAQQLAQQASGQGPSVAAQQTQATLDQQLSGAAALQASARGTSPALAARNVADRQAAASQAAAQQGMQGRLQEQLNAQGQLENVLGAGRGADIGMATNQAGLQQQNQAQINQMVQFYQQLGYSQDQAQFAANQAYQNLHVQQNLGIQGINAGAANNDKNFWSNIVGGLSSAGGTIGAAALSDRREKTDVHTGDHSIYDFLDSLHAKNFRYRDPSMAGAAAGPQTGVIAQDVQSTPVGSQMVVNGPDGKMIDPARGIGAVLAAQADLHGRLKRVEDVLGGKTVKGRVFSAGDDDQPWSTILRDPSMEAGRDYNAGSDDSPNGRTVPRSTASPAPEPSLGRRFIDAIMRAGEYVGGATPSLPDEVRKYRPDYDQPGASTSGGA